MEHITKLETIYLIRTSNHKDGRCIVDIFKFVCVTFILVSLWISSASLAAEICEGDRFPSYSQEEPILEIPRSQIYHVNLDVRGTVC